MCSRFSSCQLLVDWWSGVVIWGNYRAFRYFLCGLWGWAGLKSRASSLFCMGDGQIGLCCMERDFCKAKVNENAGFRAPFRRSRVSLLSGGRRRRGPTRIAFREVFPAGSPANGEPLYLYQGRGVYRQIL